MTARSWIVEDGTARSVSRDEATAALNGAAFVWLHFDDCEDGTEAWLDAHGDMPGLAAKALVATETRPRFDAFDHGALLNLRGPDADYATNPELLSSVRLWVANGRAITVTRRDLAALAPVEAAMKAGHVRDPGDFVSQLALAITAELDPDVAALGDTLDDCEERLGARSALALRGTIAKVRSRAISYRRFVAPQRGALETLADLDAHWIDATDRMHLKEAADRAARMAEELEAIRERAALLHEQLTDLRGELIDTRGLVLSVVALVFLPLTFFTGLLGINVDGIPYAHEPWAFAAVCAICLVSALAVAAYFVRAHWFR